MADDAIPDSINGEQTSVSINGEQTSVSINGEQTGVSITGEQTGVSITGEQTGVSITGEQSTMVQSLRNLSPAEEETMRAFLAADAIAMGQSFINDSILTAELRANQSEELAGIYYDTTPGQISEIFDEYQRNTILYHSENFSDYDGEPGVGSSIELDDAIEPDEPDRFVASVPNNAEPNPAEPEAVAEQDGSLDLGLNNAEPEAVAEQDVFLPLVVVVINAPLNANERRDAGDRIQTSLRSRVFDYLQTRSLGGRSLGGGGRRPQPTVPQSLGRQQSLVSQYLERRSIEDRMRLQPSTYTTVDFVFPGLVHDDWTFSTLDTVSSLFNFVDLHQRRPEGDIDFQHGVQILIGSRAIIRCL